MPAPIGRRHEYERLIAMVAPPGQQGASACVLVSGGPGTGRSHLVRAMAANAAAAGYQVLGLEAPILIDETMKLGDLRRMLSALVGLDQDPEPEQASDEPDVGFLKRALRSVQDSWAERMKAEQVIVQLIDRIAPAVIVIDRYTPSAAVHYWVQHTLLPHVSRSKKSVLLVVVDRPECLETLREHADLVVELGRLDADDVRTHFEALGTRIAPPITPEELDVYTAAAVDDPPTTAALDRLLTALAGGA